MRHSTHNFHLPLPTPIYRELQEEAKRSKLTITSIARQAIEQWVKQKQEQNIEASITNYAKEHGGSEFDLDPQLEATSLKHLKESQK